MTNRPGASRTPVNEAMAASPLWEGGGAAVLGFLACACVVRKTAFVGVGGFSELLFFVGEERLLAYDLAAAERARAERTRTGEGHDGDPASGRLLACGNGGSAEQAQHLTAELVGRYQDDRPPLAALPLTSDMAAVTAIGNDYGAEEVFARQVRAHGRPGDLLVCLSTSGTSRNIIAAARAGAQAGLTTWALTGPGPNPLAAAARRHAVQGPDPRLGPARGPARTAGPDGPLPPRPGRRSNARCGRPAPSW